MSVDKIIMFITGIGVLIGGIDNILNNRFGLGERLEAGFHCLGPTALSMVGIICLSPVLANILAPIVVPAFRFIGADPAMFASILAIDMGGYPLAMALAEDVRIGYFSGLIVSTTLGATIVFIIPVGLSMIEPEDRAHFAKGLLIGVTTIPIGAFLGGISLGLSPATVLLNLIPTFITAIFLILGLLFAQEKMVKGFIYFGVGIKIITLIGLCAAAFEYMTGIVLITGMSPIMDAMITVSGICIVLLGSLPLMALILKVLRKPFALVGKVLGLDAGAVGGILFSCVTILPVFGMIKDMSPRGKVVVTASLVSTVAVFAAHLGYTVSAAPEVLVPMIIAKLSGGILAVIFALHMTRKEKAA